MMLCFVDMPKLATITVAFKIHGRLANHGLTSLVKEANGDHCS